MGVIVYLTFLIENGFFERLIIGRANFRLPRAVRNVGELDYLALHAPNSRRGGRQAGIAVDTDHSAVNTDVRGHGIRHITTQCRPLAGYRERPRAAVSTASVGGTYIPYFPILFNAAVG